MQTEDLLRTGCRVVRRLAAGFCHERKKEGRKERRKEGRKEGRKERRKEGRGIKERSKKFEG
jgi:hypothetical protein